MKRKQSTWLQKRGARGGAGNGGKWGKRGSAGVEVSGSADERSITGAEKKGGTREGTWENETRTETEGEEEEKGGRGRDCRSKRNEAWQGGGGRKDGKGGRRGKGQGARRVRGVDPARSERQCEGEGARVRVSERAGRASGAESELSKREWVSWEM